MHGWTLIVPAGWAMPFFSSLTFTGTRVGGQRERQSQIFEAGCAHFPTDFPTTPFYEEFAEEDSKKNNERWARKPPAKRPNFEKLGTRSPWKADWEVVLGIKNSTASSSEDLLSTQREPAACVVRPWLFRGPEVSAIIDRASNFLSPAAALLDEINRLRLKREHDPFGVSTRAADLWKGALITVSITMRGRGAPQRMAVIHRLEDDEVLQWRTALLSSPLHIDADETSVNNPTVSDSSFKERTSDSRLSRRRRIVRLL